MTDNETNRARLLELEQAMASLDPSTEAWWACVPERNALRDAIDHAWRDAHQLGTRPATRRLPWPDDTAGRLRALRAYIEEYRGVRMALPLGPCPRRDAIEARVGPLGTAVDGWARIVDRLARDREDYGSVLRDAIGLDVVAERWLTLLVQGEGDHAWATRVDHVGQEDPMVVALVIEGRARFVEDRGPAARLTDFVRETLARHHGFLGPHPRLAQGPWTPSWRWRTWSEIWGPETLIQPSLDEVPSPERERVRAFFRERGLSTLEEGRSLAEQLGDAYPEILGAYDEAFDACLDVEGPSDYTLDELVTFLEEDVARRP